MIAEVTNFDVTGYVLKKGSGDGSDLLTVLFRAVLPEMNKENAPDFCTKTADGELFEVYDQMQSHHVYWEEEERTINELEILAAGAWMTVRAMLDHVDGLPDFMSWESP